MKEFSQISEDEKWQAVVNCDRKFDGIFFYGVKTTEIFCKPSCKSKNPARTNAIFFENLADALASGFRPCKRCCPDQTGFEPELDLVAKAKMIINADYDHSINMTSLSKRLGISSNHLSRLFKRHNGLTPSKYITKIRVDKALTLLNREELSIADIVYTTGFKSVSNFYKCFKAQTGHSPNEHRKNRGV